MYSTYGARGESTTARASHVARVREVDRDLRTDLHQGLDGSFRGSAGAPAAVEAAMLVLGRRWRPSILYLLLGGPQRYNALLRQLPGATPKMLTQQLKALEEAGLVDRFARGAAARATRSTRSRGPARRCVLCSTRSGNGRREREASGGATAAQVQNAWTEPNASNARSSRPSSGKQTPSCVASGELAEKPR